MSSTGVSLPAFPKEKEYEDYICAHFLAGGFYIEKSIILREKVELLELDILSTKFDANCTNTKLIEIKSGDWGASDIFKVKGWLVFLGYENGIFIVQKARDEFEFYKNKAKLISVDLIDNSDLSQTNKTLSQLLIKEANPIDVETIRYSYWLERNLLKQLKALKRDHEKTEIKSFKTLDAFFHNVNNASFFSNGPIERINTLFQNFLERRNITAKIAHEMGGGNFDDDIRELQGHNYSKIFYTPEFDVYQTALYCEHIARLTVLKCCIQHIIDDKNGKNQNDFDYIFDFLSLPRNIKSALDEMKTEPYFHLYPYFWQIFTYIFGGFILPDLEKKEYELLAERTGIPVEHIPNAFNAYDKLYPLDSGWFYTFPKSNIRWLKFFPPALSGVGANFRRLIYTECDNYDDLSKLVGGYHTMTDIRKWNNLAHKVLSTG